MPKRRPRFNWFIFILLSILILSTAWLYTNWQSSQKVLPPGLTLNDVPMGGMTREQAVNAISLAYTAPVTVYYANEVIILLPEMVDLSLNISATEENLEEALRGQSHIESFFAYVRDQILNREPVQLDVRAIADYSRERVDAFLARVAQKYDHPPQKPVALPEDGTFRPARMGTALDITASRPLLIAAILAANTEQRQVTLIIDTEPAPASSIDLLQDALLPLLNELPGVAGLYVKHLSGGMELCLNCGVAFSGMNTLNIAIMLETYRLLEAEANADTLNSFRKMLIADDHPAANTILAQIGGGNSTQGATQVTTLLQNLGLSSTFLAAPYDPPDGSLPSDIVTPANSRTDVNTNPDPFIQTTPMEMGLLLEGVQQCAQGGGFLRVLYPNAITPAECEGIVTMLRNNTTRPLLREAMPASAQVAHQHSWQDMTHADVALVSGPSGDFVITLFIYHPEWTSWEDSVPTFANIGSLTYRFFNGEE